MSRKKAPAKAKANSLLHGQWLGFLLLSAITLTAYWNSFGVPLVFDDLLSIQRNTGVRFGEYSWNLLSARSVLYLTFTLNYIWAGQQVWYYHLVNFLLHLLNGFLIFVLAERIFRQVEPNLQRCRTYAVLAAAFFLVHPVQTESVTYISSRSELLSTLFYLLGFLIYVFWPKHRVGFLCSIAVAVPCFLGLGSKETVITLPATIFLYDFIFIAKASFGQMLPRWRFYLTYLVGGAAASYYILTVALRGSIGNIEGHLSPWHYFLTQIRVITHYVRLVFIPLGLNLDYDYIPSTSPFEPAVVASFAFLCGLIFLGWKVRRDFPVFAFSIFWFFITLAPTSSVVPILDVIFEHRLYLPLVGVCLSFPLFLELVYKKFRQRIAIPGTPFRYSCLILAALITGTVMRNYVWSDEVRLMTDVVSKSSGKIRAYNGLSWAYYKQGEYEQAITVLRSGLDKTPDKGLELADTLANLYLKTGRYSEAIELFDRTTKAFKGDRLALAYNNMGVSYLYMWDALRLQSNQMSADEFAIRREQILKPSAAALKKGLEINPDMPGTLDSYVNVMCYRGLGSEVETLAQDRLKQKENFDDIYTLGKVAFNNNDYARADQYFERAEALRGDVKILFFNHGYALTVLKQEDRAIEKYIAAIRLDPIFIEAHHNLGQIYMRRNEFAKAADAFAEVLRQNPKHVTSNLNLAKIAISQGNNALARKYLQTVLEVSPGEQQAVALLQQIGS